VTRIRAAVLPVTGGTPEVVELELAPPRAGEVLVRIVATGVCHSDQNAIDGTAPTRCPAVLGHEGAGVVEAVGPAVDLPVGAHVVLSWLPACGACADCADGLTHLCRVAWTAVSDGTLLDGTTRITRDGEPVFHYSLLSTFATHAVVPASACVPIPDDVPFDVAALIGCAVLTGVGAVWNTARVRPGDRVAVLGCGGVGLSTVMGAVAAGADPVVAVDVSHAKLTAARECGATHVIPWAGSAEATADAIVEATRGGVDYAFEATGRPEVSRAAFLSTRRRGAAVLVGIPGTDAEVSFPARSIPLLERRVLGCIYGSSSPARDVPRILSLYRSGRLPLDRLVSHRLRLDDVDEAFRLMNDGAARRVVLTP
jgi:alcohol dehydrogenase